MSDRVREAVQHIKAGNKAEGKKILIEVLTEDERNEAAWLWMSATVETSDLRRECLEEVLKINPNNQSAIKALAHLPKDEPKSQVPDRQTTPKPEQSDMYIPAGFEPSYYADDPEPIYIEE
jgi:Tfp pilus assembly protein PilF